MRPHDGKIAPLDEAAAHGADDGGLRAETAAQLADLPGVAAMEWIILTYDTSSPHKNHNNTLLAYIVPGLLMSAMNVMLIRTFFATSIPDALFEAAQIDGASQFQIFFKIVLPLGKPILIAMGLLSGLGYWNDWTNGLYYIRDTKLYGIQNLLNKMISDLTALTQNASGASTVAIADIPSASVRMAIAFVAMLPILCLYPFLQRYFTKGIALGAVKG